MPPTTILATYNTLIQQHQQQFSPVIEQLQAIIAATLQQVQQQEQPLVQAQAQELAQLKDQLATDARCLLNSTELQTFVAQLQTVPIHTRWRQTDPLPTVAPNPADWQLAQTDINIAVRDYALSTDPEAYDDEHTYTTYGYRITIQVGTASCVIEVVRESFYSPTRRERYSLREQLEDNIQYELYAQLRELKLDEAQCTQISWEMTYLVGCAAQLLALTPESVQFQYPLREGAA